MQQPAPKTALASPLAGKKTEQINHSPDGRGGETERIKQSSDVGPHQNPAKCDPKLRKTPTNPSTAPQIRRNPHTKQAQENERQTQGRASPVATPNARSLAHQMGLETLTWAAEEEERAFA